MNAVHKLKKQKITYIGHSQGTTQMFAQLSDNGHRIKERIDMFIALAPIVHIGNIENDPLYYAAQQWDNLYYTLKFGLHLHEFNDSWVQK